MDLIVKKVSEYQVFNFLLPGTIFAAAVTKTTSIDLITNNIVVGLFSYYFIGLIISRIGSIVVEPALRKTKILVFAPYKDYLKVAKTDPKLDILSQENNAYRSLVAAAVIYLVVYFVDQVQPSIKSHFKHDELIIGICILLIILLVLSYRKQTDYIRQRVNLKK